MCLFFTVNAASEAELLHPWLSEGRKSLRCSFWALGVYLSNCHWFLYMKTNSSSQFSHSKCHINVCDIQCLVGYTNDREESIQMLHKVKSDS